MPATLSQIYCTPQDVYDLVGIDAAQLRVDDRNLASGQNVQVASDAPPGATSIGIVGTLQYGMLAGTNLTFDGGGVSAPVTVALSAAAAAGATSISVLSTTDDIPGGAQAIDDGVTTYAAGLLVKACKWATVRVNQYCNPRYDYPQLAQSNTVNQWATIVAAWWLGIRLYRAAPQHIQSMYDEALGELKEVRDATMQIADCAPRTSEWPFLSNVTIDLTYTIRKVRVEPQISEPTPTQYAQAIDWNSALALEW